MTVLTLYGHGYCHLCHEMWETLLPLQGELNFSAEWIDIEGRPDLEALFGEQVPVLMAGENEICHYHLDLVALKAQLDSR